MGVSTPTVDRTYQARSSLHVMSATQSSTSGPRQRSMPSKASLQPSHTEKGNPNFTLRGIAAHTRQPPHHPVALLKPNPAPTINLHGVRHNGAHHGSTLQSGKGGHFEALALVRPNTITYVRGHTHTRGHTTTLSCLAQRSCTNYIVWT